MREYNGSRMNILLNILSLANASFSCLHILIMPGSNLSFPTLRTIRKLYKQGVSARELTKRVGCSMKTIYNTIQKECIDPIHRTKQNVGRKRKLNESKCEQLNNILEENNKLGSRRLAPIVNKRLRISLSDSTIRRYAARAGFKWKKPTKKPFLSALHKSKRLAWAYKHRATDWSSWVFSDETSVNIYGSNYGQRVREDEKVIEERVKHPLKVHCWWAISTHTDFTPYIFTGTLTGELYLRILQSRLPSTHEWHSAREWVFQQDGDPKHKERGVVNWLNSNTATWTSDWPPNSPDLNPIENVWSTVKAHVHEQQPNSQQELERAVQKACRHIRADAIERAINSMPKRIEAVIAAKGGHTKY
jgi:transposase